MEVTKQADNSVLIKLDNGNKIRIIEVESGVIQLENVTEKNDPMYPLGLKIYPMGISVVEIVPEG